MRFITRDFDKRRPVRRGDFLSVHVESHVFIEFNVKSLIVRGKNRVSLALEIGRGIEIFDPVRTDIIYYFDSASFKELFFYFIVTFIAAIVVDIGERASLGGVFEYDVERRILVDFVWENNRFTRFRTRFYGDFFSRKIGALRKRVV